MNKKHEPLFGCCICRDERTFPADHLRIYCGDLWCSDCWHDDGMDICSGIEHHNLPQFIPEADLKIQALTEGLQAIKRYMQMYGGGNMYQISSAWKIADETLTKAEAIGK